jgi:RNA polymerase sigma-70 factor (ECF subfamily)
LRVTIPRIRVYANRNCISDPATLTSAGLCRGYDWSRLPRHIHRSLQFRLQRNFLSTLQTGKNCVVFQTFQNTSANEMISFSLPNPFVSSYSMDMDQIQTIDNEPELVRKAQRGDRRAFSLLVKKYESTVYGFAFKVCRNEEKAAETLQDTFVNVYRKLHQFNGKAKFSTWLYQIVTNNCLMKRRRSKLDNSSVSIESDDSGAEDLELRGGGAPLQALISLRQTPQDEVMNEELREILDNAILKLPMEHRIVFILRDVEGRSAEEAAKILKISVPAVKSRLHRARVFLRAQLQEYIEV